jgi:hypothetical protein
MIIGECPYDDCDGSHMIAIAPQCPALSKHECETCGKEFWMYHSRIDPAAYTLKGFEETFWINEETKEFGKRKEAENQPA